MQNRRRIIGSVAGIALVAVLVWRVNADIVNDPVQAMIGASPAGGVRLNAHFAYYVNPFVLVLDLRRADTTAPMVLFRGVLAAAYAMRQSYRPFNHVALAHSGKTVFTLGGNEFDALGAGFGRGQSREFLIVGMTGMLRTPSGVAAYKSRQLGVSREFAAGRVDAQDAARRWVQ